MTDQGRSSTPIERMDMTVTSLSADDERCRALLGDHEWRRLGLHLPLERLTERERAFRRGVLAALDVRADPAPCAIHDHSGPLRDLDLRTASRLQCEGLAHTGQCRAVQTGGAMLCDCGALEAEWQRRVAAGADGRPRMSAARVIEVTIGLGDDDAPPGEGPPRLAAAVLAALQAEGYRVTP